MQSSATSSEIEFRREQAKRLHEALETKKAQFPRMVALLGNEIRFCDLRKDRRGHWGAGYTYKVFAHNQMEQAIEWIESL